MHSTAAYIMHYIYPCLVIFFFLCIAQYKPIVAVFFVFKLEEISVAYTVLGRMTHSPSSFIPHLFHHAVHHTRCLS